MSISRFRIRASYPNFYMVTLYAREGREIFDHDSEDPANQLGGETITDTTRENAKEMLKNAQGK